MGVLTTLLKPFQAWNDAVLPVGRWIAVVAIGLMVLAILIQVFFRYVLNNALAWPDEAARFMMLWMTAVIAPLAYRRGGFVAIDMLPEALPRRLGEALNLVLLLIAAVVLVVAVRIGWGELGGFMARASTSSLYVPLPDAACTSLLGKPFGDGPWCRVPRIWGYSSFWVGMVLLLVVNVELILRSLIAMLGGAERLRPLGPPDEEIMAE